jgi:hypothetical protein
VGVLEQLRKVGDYVRKGWRFAADNSYREYKHGRDRERKRVDSERQDAERFADRKRGKAERERGYEERYAAERAGEEPHPETPPDDASKPD